MITDSKKWHYLAVKRLSAFLRGITSSYNGDFYCLNCFHSYRTKKHKKIILKIPTQREKPSMNLQAGQRLQNVHLIK